MKKSALLFRLLASVSILPVFTACNIYSPLASVSSVEDYREEALKCLQQGNYACAISNYKNLPAGTEQSQDLCTADMGQAGMTLTALVNVVSNQTTGSKLLGALAQQLVPWNSTRGGAAAQAVTDCSSIPAGSNPALNTLLQALSLLLDCSSRISRADVQQGVSDGDTTCTSSGPNSGAIASTDISPDGTGTLNSGAGMCAPDVTTCLTDLAALINLLGLLQADGLGDMASNIIATPGGLFSTATGVDAARALLRTTTLQ